MKGTDVIAVVLAAGQGTRMKSETPKVLFPLCGRPMLSWAVSAARQAGAGEVVVVVGHGRAEVEAAVYERDQDAKLAVQPEQRGTGHAVQCAMGALEGHAGTVLILYGDCPLIGPAALEALLAAHREAGEVLSMLTGHLSDPSGYGRIVRDGQGRVTCIREHRDCSDAELGIDEVNPGLYAIEAPFLRDGLAQLDSDNDQGEIYLTDLVERAASQAPVATVRWDMADLRGINDRWELSQAELALRLRILRDHALGGVTIRDPGHTYVDADVLIEPGAVLEPGVVLRGACRIGQDATVGPGCVLDHVIVDRDATLLPYTVATDSHIGEGAQAGPFSHLRPQTDLGPEAKVGNFVETKKTRMGRGSKANHLSYLGDGLIGEDVNVGAGTIFCNYDGFQKHTTVLEDGCFIGSDSQIVAPIRVGKGAYVATGTTVTRDVPDDALAVARTRQQNKEGYAPRLRARLQKKK